MCACERACASVCAPVRPARHARAQKGAPASAAGGVGPLREPQARSFCFSSPCISFSIFVWMKIMCPSDTAKLKLHLVS